MIDSKKTKSRLLGGAAALGIASAFIAGGVVSPVTPVLADAVRIEAPQAPSFADVVEAVSPAVVSVRVKAAVQPASDRSFRTPGFDQFGEDHPFRRFFDRRGGGDRQFRNRDRRGGKNRPNRRFGQSQGSGFFVSEDGYIVTNNHVIENGSKFTIVMNDGKELEASLVGADPKTDLAVLKVDEKRKFTYVQFSDEQSRVGEWVVAVGNPFGLGGTVTAGIVSASNRDIGSGPYDDFIQIDAAVNKGNSGGPAFNLNGEVIGVNTAIFSPSGGNVGIAFAISAKSAQNVVESLIESGSVTRGWLGVQIQPVTEDIAESIGLAKAAGAIVSETQKDSPAADAGLQSGDVVLKVDKESVETPKSLARIIAGYAPSETAALTIFRDGEEQVIEVELGKLPGTAKKASLETDRSDKRDQASVDVEQFGLSVAETENGVVVSEIDESGVAASKGVRVGDIVKSINGLETSSIDEVGEAVAEALEDDRKAVLFQLKTGERSRFVALPVEKG